jgi:Tat protein translocase TatB subunit
MDFFGIGAGELLLIIIVAFIVIGPAKIPKAAKTIGKTISALKKASSELTSQVNKELEEEEKTLSDSKNILADPLNASLDKGATISTSSDNRKE